MTVAQAAAADNVSVFKFARWRRQGVILDEVLNQYKSVGAELNVLPYCTQFIPMEVITEPCHQSICYHPSLLPVHRGASSINWSAALTFDKLRIVLVNLNGFQMDTFGESENVTAFLQCWSFLHSLVL